MSQLERRSQFRDASRATKVGFGDNRETCKRQSLRKEEKVRIYWRDRADACFLLYPIVFLLLSLVGVWVGPPGRGLDHELKFLTDVLFFNSVHASLTLWALLLLPAARPWRVAKQERPAWLGFWPKALLLMTVLAAFFAVKLGYLQVAQEIFRPFDIAFAFIARVIPTQHTIWQVLGLSILFHQIQKRERGVTEPTPAISAHDRREKLYFLAFLALALIPPLAGRGIEIWQIHELQSSRGPLGWIISGLLLGLTVLLVRHQLQSPLGADPRRALYVSRLAVWALVPISPWAFYAAAAVHGIEYVFVMWRLIPIEQRVWKRWLVPGLALFTVAGALIRYASHLGDTQAPAQIPLWMAAAQVIVLTIQWIHYHFDRELFLMRDPATRAFTGRQLNLWFEPRRG